MRLRDRIGSSAAGLAAWLAPTAVLASEAGHGVVHGPDRAFWFAVINFVIFVFLLIKFTRKPVADFLTQRQGTLQKVISEVQQQREELAQQQAELSKTLAEFESVRASRVALATQAAEDEAQAILKEARELAQSMIEGARARAQGILQSGEDEAVRRFVTQLVADAETKLKGADASLLDRGFVGRVSAAVQNQAQG